MASETITRNDLKAVLDKILPSSFNVETVTLSGSYNLIAKAYKRNGMVMMSVWQTAVASLPKGAWTLVGVLPQEFRPLHQVDVLGVENNTSSVQNNSMQIRVSVNGNVSVWAYSDGITSNQLLHTITYMCDEAEYTGVTKLQADYIVEQGTSGIWTYRKWNSGVAECWGKTEVAAYTYTANGGSKQVSEAVPTAIFNGAPTVVNANGYIASLVQTQTGFTYADASWIQTYLINRSGSSVNAGGGVYWTLKGRWK